MPDIYRIRFSEAASIDLVGIFDFIRQDSPQNAAASIRGLLSAIDSLEILPHRYPVVEDSLRLLRKELRSMPVPPFKVRYQVDDLRLAVTVVGVRHGARTE
jgi:plasmid stabilization system protein ParE